MDTDELIEATESVLEAYAKDKELSEYYGLERLLAGQVCAQLAIARELKRMNDWREDEAERMELRQVWKGE